MQNMPIGIFRGDDTDAFSYQTIVGTIKTDLDLTGCKAVFGYLGFSMEFDPIPEDRKLTIVIPADETKKFPPGLGYASLRVYDSEDRLKTFSNRIMVFVATKTPMFGGDEFEVDFNVRASLEPLKFFVGPNPDDFDEYRGYVEKVIDRASAEKYGLSILLDAIDSDLGANEGVAATPVAVKAAYAAIIQKLTDDYYTAGQTDEAIDRVAAYYITYDAAGNPFPTYAALANAQTVYSGGKIRVPTRNDYCVVLADETHQGAEYRYIYAVADGETTGSWQPQFPVEGVMTIDQSVVRNSQNPVSGGGVWSAIWGALASLPTGFSSLYDWCVSQLAGKVPNTREVNGKALSSDVTLTGADIAVSGTDATKIDAALAGKATKSDAKLTPRYADEWIVNPVYPEGYTSYTGPTWSNLDSGWVIYYHGDSGEPMLGTLVMEPPNALTLSFQDGTTATRQSTEHALIGYVLGTQTDKPLASEAEAEALRQGKQNALSSQQLANIAAVSDALAFDATHSYAAGDPVVYDGMLYTFTATHTGAWTGSDVSAVDIIARLAGKANDNAVVKLTGDQDIGGNKTFYGDVAIADQKDFNVYGGRVAVRSSGGSDVALFEYDRLEYSTDGGMTWTSVMLDDIAPLASPAFTGTPTAPTPTSGDDSTKIATTEFVQGAVPYALVTKTIANGAVSLDDRAINAVAVSSSLASLTVNFPTATSGKARDFGLRLTVASGITTAPQIVLPQGVTCENADGEAPEIGADGAATILYFTETASGVFLVKGEVLQTITA